MNGIIYIAVNRRTQMAYVGATKRDWAARAMEHVYDAVNRPRSPLHEAIIADGVESFDFAILEHTDFLWGREMHWIEVLRTRCPDGYNVSKGPGSKGVEHTEEERQKIRDFFKGVPKSAAHRAKLRGPKSPAHIANAIKARSTEEFKLKASASAKAAWVKRKAS